MYANLPSLGGGGYPATSISSVATTGEFTLNPAGSGDDSVALAALITAGARKIRLGSGTFTFKSTLTVGFDGIHIEGNGANATFISIDDSGGNIGDAIKVNSVLDFSIRRVTFTATAARSAGSAIKVLGKNNIIATPAQKTNQYIIRDCNFDTQFNCVVFNDGPASAGAWGGHMESCQITGMSAGGVGVWINSPSGGQHYLRHLKIYGDSTAIDANRPLAGIRYQGGADMELHNINTIYMRNGLRIDPPNGQAANVTTMMACLWDSNTQASILIAPQAGGTVNGFDGSSGWGYTPASNSLPCVQIDGGNFITFKGGKYFGNFLAFKISGPAKYVTLLGTDTSGSVTGYQATNSATDFTIQGNRCGIYNAVTPTTGIIVDAACDRYTITGNNVREATTKITNTPGTAANQRIVQDNVIV